LQTPALTSWPRRPGASPFYSKFYNYAIIVNKLLYARTYLTPYPSPACIIVTSGVLFGRRGEELMRGASAPLRKLLPSGFKSLLVSPSTSSGQALYEREKDMASRFTEILSGASKRGETSLYLSPPLKQEINTRIKMSLFERGIKGVCE
jgi:hypothetical protein